VIARKAKKLAEACVAAVVRRLLPREREQPGKPARGKQSAGSVEPDPARTARIRRYTALSLKERYGEHGPP